MTESVDRTPAAEDPAEGNRLSALVRQLGRARRPERDAQVVDAQVVDAQVVAALDSLPVGFCLFDADDRLVYASAGFRRIFEQPLDRAPPGMHCRDMIIESVRHGLYAGRDPEAIWAERRAFVARRVPGTVLQTFADGRLIAITHQPQEGGGWAAYYEDVTERRRAETALRFMAHHDELTGLPNRYVLAERLDGALVAVGGGGSCALLCLDLDHFKPVNDRHGHAAGDALLRQVAERLRGMTDPSDVAARIGGDEFAVLLAGTGPAAAETFAGRVLAGLTAPYELGGAGSVTIGIGIGIACAPEHASGARSLLERADAALYASKRLGRPCLWHAGLRRAAPAETAP